MPDDPERALLAFINARWGEEEETARDAGPGYTGDHGLWVQDDDAHYPLLIGPARVLDEIQAKRRIVELHTGPHECSVADNNCAWLLGADECDTVLWIVWPHRHRPGWDPAWAPEGMES